MIRASGTRGEWIEGALIVLIGICAGIALGLLLLLLFKVSQ